MDHLVFNQWPAMSLRREIVSERHVGLIRAFMATESMSTPRMFVVVAGLVTLSEITAKPSSSHVAIMIVMLVQTGECGGPTVK